MISSMELSPEEKFGATIVQKACEEPIRQIAANAGLEASIVINNILNNKSKAYGFNALTEVYEDLLKSGVIDPVKVVRCGLENAASVSSLMLTTETMIAEAPSKEEPAAGGMPGGMGGMGGMGGGMPMM